MLPFDRPADRHLKNWAQLAEVYGRVRPRPATDAVALAGIGIRARRREADICMSIGIISGTR